MFSILKVQGKSMSPFYQEGDYLFVFKPFWKRCPRVEDIVIFGHEHYGLLVKKVTSVDWDKKVFYSEGINDDSISEEEIGAVLFEKIRGYPIHHIKS